MENWRKRAAILMAFSLVLGTILVIAKGIGRSDNIPRPAPKPEKLEIQAETPPDTDEMPPAPASQRPATPPAQAAPTALKAPVAQRTPAPPGPGRPESSESLSNTLRSEATRENALRALFSSRELEQDGKIDREKIGKSIQNYVAQYRPHLKLSDADKGRLVDLVVEFREVNREVQSAQRSGANTPELGQNIKRMQNAMDAFRKMTDVPSENVFGAETPAPLFGDAATKPEEDPFEKFGVE